MPRDGSGNYTLPAGNPVQSLTPISSVVENATDSDLGAEITKSIARDGQSVPFANLPMGGFRHTNVSPAVLGNDYATLSQSQTNAAGYVLDTSLVPNAIFISPVPPISSYETGQRWRVKLANTNTAQTTILVSGLSSKRVLLQGKAALYAGALLAGNISDLSYDGSDFICLNPVPAPAAPPPTPPLTNAILQVQTGTALGFVFNPSASQLAGYSRFRFQIGPGVILDGPSNIRVALSNNAGATFFSDTSDYVGAFEIVSLGSELLGSQTVVAAKSGGRSMPVTGSGVNDGQFVSGDVEIVFTPGLLNSQVTVNGVGGAYVCRSVGARTSSIGHNAVSFFTDPPVSLAGSITMIGIL